ncbi:ubiquitin carboxyl-terminal hydrolase MINDY-2 isoform X2 [Tachysurus fulvidraco]|uniref:ubiquitin carboxyl-terminal hydrolase MINDY-2 isoform X2 n=1 Tax=Tachysurus fulvidraco TaxID=1234273 RepID=UPI001FEF4FC4|nr:ubiquitin carboxyl-terminal hydrolase MINDY-2 isoform X2 [Tachysurus fulvidraco]
MESNAALHGDATEAGGSGETGNVNAELSVSSLGPSCTTSATTTTTPSANANASANAASRTDTADVVETVEAGEPGNVLGHGACESDAGNHDATNSQLVNKPSRGEPSKGATSVRADIRDQEASRLPKQSSVCAVVCAESSVCAVVCAESSVCAVVCAESSVCPAKAKSESNEGTLSQGLPSLDSLDSFSNLNSSCPSSEPVSEGLEDQEKAVIPQGQHGAEGGKTQSCRDRVIAGQSIYHIKWIKWKEENTPIITQNENGPCPLLAIMNVLLLAWKVKLPPMIEIITAEQLMEYLGDYILDAKPKEISEAQRLNYEQNMSDAMAVLHKLQTGLDVNVKFTGVRVFEYTPECIVFDLLDIPLYHGWLVEPQMSDIVKAVGNCSYNQLVEKIIGYKQSENSELAGEGFVAEQFLHNTATQLTYHGLCELTSTVQEGELCVFFRNNHFSTMTKFKGQLYLLVTDQGFLTEEKVVWESLHNVDGDGNFCDSEFRLRPSDPESVYHGQQDQIDQDYLMALSLQQEQQVSELGWELPEGISDLELAKKLQEEEDRRASEFYQEQEDEQEQAAAAAQAAQAQAGGGAVAEGAVAAPAGGAATCSSPGKHSSSTERKTKKEAKEKEKCVIL